MTPCFLFLFEHRRAGVLIDSWRYTDAEQGVAELPGFALQSWDSAPVSIAAVSHSNEQQSAILDVTCPADFPVVSMFLGGSPMGQVWLTIWRHDGTAGDLIWRGTVRAPEWSGGITAKLSVDSLKSRGDRKALRLTYAAGCQKVLYSTDPPGLPGFGCGVDREANTRTGTVLTVSADGRTIGTTLSESAGFFKLGFFQARGRQVMTLESTAGPNSQLQLLSPIVGLSPGDVVQATKGCNHSKTACIGFGNLARFGGHDTVPRFNPFEQPLNALL